MRKPTPIAKVSADASRVPTTTAKVIHPKADPREPEVHAPEVPAMNIQTANALVTGAPIREEQLRVAMDHFKALESLLSISGPRFSNARSEAANQHNAAVRRLRETRDQAVLRARRYQEAKDGLIEIGNI